MKKLLSLLIIIYCLLKCSDSKKINEIKDFKDLSKLMDLKLLLKQANPGANTTESTQVSAQKQGPCYCGGGLCGCCSRILMNTFNQKACVNVTYDPDEFAFTAKVMMNDRLLYTRTVSGKNPRPVCVPVPRIPAVRACIRFYNIYFQGRNVHACISMEGKFSDTTLFKMGLDCIRLGANGVALVTPEDGGGIGQVEWLPEDPAGANDTEEYEEYDNDDDEDDDYIF